MLIACIEIALSKNGKGEVSCNVHKTCILCIVVNRKLKEIYNELAYPKMRSSNMNDIISYVKILRQMIRNCLILKTNYSQTIPRYLFNNDKSNTCLRFKH